MKQIYTTENYYDSQSLLGYFPFKKPNMSFGDYDGNGYTDFISYPSHFTTDPLLSSVMWNGSSSGYTPTKLTSGVEFARWSLDADFNNDGYDDSIVLDTGFEGNNRNPDSFFGSSLKYFTGSPTGLVENHNAITGQPNTNGNGTFNHIGSYGDIDNDGDLDVVVAAFKNLDIYINDGNGNFSYSSQDLVDPDYITTNKNFDSSHLNYWYSGVGISEVNGEPAIIAGTYRSFGSNVTDEQQSLDVYTVNADGKFTITQQLDRPDLFGNGHDYGVVGVHSTDIDGNGTKDLLVEFETEQNYAQSGNLVIATYVQDTDGLYSLDDNRTIHMIDDGQKEVRINLIDVNNDGYDDFSVLSHGMKVENANQSLWINDRQGNFSPVSKKFVSLDHLPEWKQVSPHWVDLDNDNQAELVLQDAIYREISEDGTIGEYFEIYKPDNQMFDNTKVFQEGKFLSFESDDLSLPKVITTTLGYPESNNKWICGVGLQLLDSGNTIENVARLALDYVGADTNQETVETVYYNLVGEQPSQLETMIYETMVEDMGRGEFALWASDYADEFTPFDQSYINTYGLEYLI